MQRPLPPNNAIEETLRERRKKIQTLKIEAQQCVQASGCQGSCLYEPLSCFIPVREDMQRGILILFYRHEPRRSSVHIFMHNYLCCLNPIGSRGGFGGFSNCFNAAKIISISSSFFTVLLPCCINSFSIFSNFNKISL